MFGSKPAVGKPSPSPFPTFLLPSLTIPFRRHRSLSVRPDPPGDASSAPSLSSSLSSTSDRPGSPASPTTTHFTDYYSSSRDDHDPASCPPSGRRLSRTHPDTLRCRSCSADLAFGAQIVSKGFTGRHGRAYLVSPPSAMPTAPAFSSGFRLPALIPAQIGSVGSSKSPADASNLANIRVGRSENRSLVTGAHVVADIRCALCDSRLGWKYVDAREPSQRYKIGKFLLDTQRVVSTRNWEDVGSDEDAPSGLSDHDDPLGEDRASSILRQKLRAVESGRDDGENDDYDETRNEVEGDVGAIVFDSDDEDECDDIFAGTWDPHVVARRRQSRVAN